jgi:mutator protein MutT
MQRKVTDVAVGVVIDPITGRYLLGSRPEGKPYAGYWEFPGGKLEVGETVHEALARELREELGVDIGPSSPWFVMEHDYPHAYVRLYFRRTWEWSGECRSLENQHFGWFGEDDDVESMQLLPMDALIIHRIFLPEVLIAANRSDALSQCATLRNQAVKAAVLFAKPDAELQAQCKAEKIPCLVAGESVRCPSDWASVADAAAQEWLCAVMDDATGLDAGTHRAPVYVPGGIDDLDAVKRRGAHGIVIG